MNDQTVAEMRGQANVFTFEGPLLEVKEAFATWCSVEIDGATARELGKHSTLEMMIQEPTGAMFVVPRFEEECRINWREGVLTSILPNVVRLHVSRCGVQTVGAPQCLSGAEKFGQHEAESKHTSALKMVG